MDTATRESLIYNQINKGPDGHDSLHWLQVRHLDGQAIANLFTFSAHPTFLGRVSTEVSGDYPGIAQKLAEQRLGTPTLFAVGAVGGMLPMGLGKTPLGTLAEQQAQMQDMAERLIDVLVAAKDDSVNWQGQEAIVDSIVQHVDLPSQSFRWHDDWRLSPYFISTIFHDRQSYVHALRIGPIYWLNYPADYAGELAQQLEDWGDENAVYTWVNSFNGDYIGYVLPSERYDSDHYSARGVNFYGRWAGDYLNEVGKQLIISSQNND
jgi:hypothetical protein